MIRDAVETPTACCLCGGSERPPSTSCRLCHGDGVVSRAVAARWRSSQEAKRTTSTHTIAGLVEALCIRLERVERDQLASDLAEHGRDLLAVIASWEHAPAKGPERVAHYRTRCAPWMTTALDRLKHIDTARKDPS